MKLKIKQHTSVSIFYPTILILQNTSLQLELHVPRSLVFIFLCLSLSLPSLWTMALSSWRHFQQEELVNIIGVGKEIFTRHSLKSMGLGTANLVWNFPKFYFFVPVAAPRIFLRVFIKKFKLYKILEKDNFIHWPKTHTHTHIHKILQFPSTIFF